MSRLGKTTKKYYKETMGLKVSGGQFVKGGTVLTRQGDKWQPGVNVIGRTHLTASCDGQVYFSKKMGSYKKVLTIVNVKPAEAK